MDNYGLLIDMDDVIDKNDDSIPEAVDLINSLIRAEISFLLLVNDSQKSRLETTLKFQKMGFKVTVDQIYMSDIPIKEFISKLNTDTSTFILSAEYLVHALQMNEINCTGKDTTFTVVDDILPGFRSALIFSSVTENATASNHHTSSSKNMDSFVSLKVESIKKFFSPEGKPELRVV